MTERETLDAVRLGALSFEYSPDGFGPLLETIGDATVVCLGEASQGTREFYTAGAELTKACPARRSVRRGDARRPHAGPAAATCPICPSVCERA